MRKQKGFSLIELLIVVAIILIIAAIAIPSLIRSKATANEAGGAATTSGSESLRAYATCTGSGRPSESTSGGGGRSGSRPGSSCRSSSTAIDAG